MCGFTIARSTYFRRFPVVEVQQTFYDPPSSTVLERWRTDAPADFEFTMKAWQTITHRGTSSTYRRLVSAFSDGQRAEAGDFRVNETVMGAWDRTLECAAILRATAILFQCPASFRATAENVASMQEFFAAIDRPRGVRLMQEPRGPWPGTLVRDLCGELSLIHAVDPFVRPSQTPSLIYWRLHGNGNSYAHYTDDELRQIHGWLDQSDAVDAYVLFNNIPRVKDIARFAELAPQYSR